MTISDNQKKYIRQIKTKNFIIVFLRIVLILGFIAAWEILANNNIIDPFIYSSPSRILKCIYNLYLHNNLFNHVIATLKEIFISFIIGILLGFFITVIFYEYDFIYQIFEPLLTIFNSLPKVALGPMIIIIAGANIKSIIIMAIFINMIVSITTIYTGFMNVDPIRIKMFKSFYANKYQILTRLIIPNSRNSIVTSLKLNISLTLIGVITGEFLVSKQGIGYLIIYGTQVFNLNLVMSGIFLLIIISYILYKIVNSIK